ncbi:haloalkane dehalogenase [Leptospira sp. GIMC2001]|uniref:haloalkane dehalogenase n=1 Tax=Leptospira sp. GIMC2001 TaxID=1513297 RepID=UPI002349FD14|nr:haloalkane dehalogenase [Leptospira sp. GIMC2001]WCL49272.1 haloalkane dehalogenase [Leptospira sp. GIMC2001]
MSNEIPFLRTPDHNFENLPGYPFKPNYLQINPGNLRIHYLDENSISEQTVLLMHGEPSWSYLYRKMIPIFAKSGFRVIAPDLIGFGKSDKPIDRSVYSYAIYVEWITEFIKSLDLQNITLVCQDWGGLIGLRVAAENPERFVRISAANTFLPTGEFPLPQSFLEWHNFSQKAKRLPVGKIIKGGCVREVSPDVIRAYNAPFPDESYKAAARVFPTLVPSNPEDPASIANIKAWNILRKWTKPFLTAFSDQDPVTKGGDLIFRRRIPGTKGQPHTTIKNAGHFLQEDCGEEWANLIIDWIQNQK